MNLVFIYIFIVVLCWTLNPFIKKRVLNKLNANEYLIVNHMIVTLFILLYFYYIFKNNKCDINCLKKLDKYDLLLIIIGGVTTILGSFLLMNLINNTDVSYAIAHIQPIVISLTIILGFVFFNEKITYSKVIGIILVITGLIIINSKKLDNLLK